MELRVKTQKLHLEAKFSRIDHNGNKSVVLLFDGQTIVLLETMGRI